MLINKAPDTIIIHYCKGLKLKAVWNHLEKLVKEEKKMHNTPPSC